MAEPLIPEWITQIVVFGIVGVVGLIAVVALGAWTIETVSQAVKRRKE